MELNGRMACILLELLETGGCLPISQICSSLQISRRTFYYDFDKLRSWLKLHRYGRIQLSNSVCCLEAEDPEALKATIEAGVTAYYITCRERLVLELFYIVLYGGRPGVLEALRAMFDVSQNTVLADIKKVRSYLGESGISLKYVGQKGYLFTGDEFQLRRCLLQKAEELKSGRVRKYLGAMVSQRLNEVLGRKADYMGVLRESVLIYEEVVGTTLLDYQLNQQVLMIALAYLRSTDGFPFLVSDAEREDLEQLQEFSGVQRMLQRMREYTGLAMPDTEFYFIEILFLGMRNFDFNGESTAHKNITELTERFLCYLESTYSLHFPNREKLLNRLVLHNTPMYYRIKYGVQEANPLLDSYRIKYGREFDMASAALKLTAPELAELISDDEIAYLAMYIGGELYGWQKVKRLHQGERILVVCGSGVATSILVGNQLDELLNGAYEIDFHAVKALDYQNLGDYFMVISTVRYPRLPDGTIYVSPILTVKDRTEIIARLNQQKFSAWDITLGEIMDIIGHFVPSDAKLLPMNYELEKYFSRKKLHGEK
jgi:mannitol operon transcriptional antiterminator